MRIETPDGVFPVETDQHRSEAKFMAAAKCVSAEILSVSEIPQVSVMLAGLPASRWLTLRVHAPDGDYEADACVSTVGVPRPEVGMNIHVWIDPTRRDRLELQLSDLVSPDLPQATL